MSSDSPLLNLPTAQELFAQMMEYLGKLLPSVMPFFLLGALGLAALLLLKHWMVRRARRLFFPGVLADGGPQLLFEVTSRINRSMEFSLIGLWHFIRKPYTHAACWYVSNSNRDVFEGMLDASKNSEKFGAALLRIAEKMPSGVHRIDIWALWSHVMEFAERPETHEQLAASGYTIETSLVAVEQGIPLEYAEALAGDRSLV